MNKSATLVRLALAAACLLLAGRTEAADKGPRPGVWRIDFVGPKGVKWVAELVLREEGRLTYSGTAEWRSADGVKRRREYFEGIYDPREKTITLVSKDKAAKKGTVSNAGKYVATVSEDGAKMTNGKWTYLDQPPGKWSAVRKK